MSHQEDAARISFQVPDQPIQESTTPKLETKQSSWRKKGNEVAMKKIIDLLYSKVVQDAYLSPFFQGINMLTLKRQQERLMALVFGGIDLVQEEFPEFNLRAIHMRLLVEGGLTLPHWEAFVQHFRLTLEGLEDIPDEARQLAVAWLRSTQDAFGPPTPEEVAAFHASKAAGAAAAAKCPMSLG